MAVALEPVLPFATPEASWKLAGGRASLASKHHRIPGPTALRPEGCAGNPPAASGTPSGVPFVWRMRSGGVRSCPQCFAQHGRRACLARPPAHLRHPSGIPETLRTDAPATLHPMPKCRTGSKAKHLNRQICLEDAEFGNEKFDPRPLCADSDAW